MTKQKKKKKEEPDNFYTEILLHVKEKEERHWNNPEKQEISLILHLFISVNRYSNLGSPLADIWLHKAEPVTAWRDQKAARLCESVCHCVSETVVYSDEPGWQGLGDQPYAPCQSDI